MHIDPNDGTVTLPNGYVIGPSLTQEAFLIGEMADQAEAQDFGTLPWIHYSFAGGRVERNDLLVSLCFYDQMLIDVTLNVDLYPPEASGWEDYSLDVEAAAKTIHDRLLEASLGKPSESKRLPGGSFSKTQATLETPHVWNFEWGEASSSHDVRGGSTLIIVRDGDRHTQAVKAYQKRPGGEGGA